MTYKEKRLQEFTDKFHQNDQYYDIKEFLSETIDECHSFNARCLGVDDLDAYTALAMEYERGWNAHHDAVEAKFEGKEEKPTHGCWACGIAHKHGECGK